MDLQKAVGRNIKNIRENKKITLDTAANLTGVSRSMLAQIEKGEVNPTISILWKIANGYKVSFNSLIKTTSSTLFIRSQELLPLLEDEGRFINYPVFPFGDVTQFETNILEIKKGGLQQSAPHLGGAEEYITVFAGEVEITAGEEKFVLRKGDSLRFQADVEHSYRNLGDEPVLMHLIIYYADK
jgi:transcriptional regulator with XRE-family HTH domain